MAGSTLSVLLFSDVEDRSLEHLYTAVPEIDFHSFTDISDIPDNTKLLITNRRLPDNLMRLCIRRSVKIWAILGCDTCEDADDVLPRDFSAEYIKVKLEKFVRGRSYLDLNNRLALQLANEISNAIILCNAEGKLLWANKGFEHIYECSRQEFIEANGDVLFDFSVNPEIQTLVQRFDESKNSVQFINQITSSRGVNKWLQTTLTPIYERNHLKYVVALESDITDLKQAQHKLELQGKSMEELASKLKDINHELEAQRNELDKKNQQLLDEKERSDQLLHNILPEIVAHQLKKGKKKPKHYKSVTVMFADFKGFSKISKTLSPIEIVQTLDELFCKFDEIVDKHFIEKIKTVGDAYMCAGGLPMKNNSHYVNVLMAALEIQQFLFDFNKPRMLNKEVTWECRIGIHSGEVFAGVVGQKKFAYDIWGDTVNVAARMETNGAVNSVNISEATYEYVKDYFECIPRGEIEAKNIGKVNMFFVTGLKPQYSVDAIGVEPNEEFIKILRGL